MARPKKHEHEARSESTRADLTLAEKEQLRDRVRAAGFRSEAEFVRHAIFNTAIRSPAPSSAPDPALVTELNSIGVALKSGVGNNLNQLVHDMHIGRDCRIPPDLVLTELRSTITRLDKALRKVVDDGS